MLNESNSVKPVLIVGADGLIGRSLVDILESTRQSVWQTSRQRNGSSKKEFFLDLSLDSASWSIPAVAFESAIICSAITSVEQCRIEPEKSAKINVTATLALAKYLVSNGVFVVFISSNLVFDGALPYAKSTDLTTPQTNYGQQKAQAEQELLKLGNGVAVVRFSKILSPEMKLIKNWIRDLRMGVAIHPFSDMVLSPVSLRFAASVLQRVAAMKISGITQISASQDVSYEAVARYLACKLGVNKNLIEPITTENDDYSAPQVNTTLDISRLQNVLLMTPPDVWETIDSLLI